MGKILQKDGGGESGGIYEVNYRLENYMKFRVEGQV